MDAPGQSDIFPVTVDYHDGEQHPTLVRIEGIPDYLTEITRPMSP